MPGFESNRFIDLSERETKHLKCSICFNIFDNGVRSGCDHTFCKSCIEQWIRSNRKTCPECRKKFLNRKRSPEDIGETVFVGNYVFYRNLLANNLVNELKTKCDFQSYGCQVIIEFGLLSAHLKQCEHRICKTCGIAREASISHNCIESLKTLVKELRQKLVKENGINTDIAVGGTTISCPHILIGDYKTSSKGLELLINSFRVSNVKPNNDVNYTYHLMLPFIDIWELMFCINPLLPVLIIRPTLSSSKKIEESFALGPNSANGFRFDVNSNDEKNRFIIFVLKCETNEYQNCIAFIVDKSKKANRELKCEAIDIETTRLIIERTGTTVESLRN